MAIFVKNTFSDITFYLCEYKQISTSGGRLGCGPPCDTVSRPYILRAAANNRVRGHASVCGYAPPSPTLDKDETPINIFLDLSKAFDTLNHTILLNRFNKS